MTGIVILADLTTNWLNHPSRIFSDFGGQSVIETLLSQLQELQLPVYLSVFEGEHRAKELQQLKMRFSNLHLVYSQSKDEIERIYAIARNQKFTKIVRLSADNPFLGLDVLKRMLEETEPVYQYTYGYPVGIQIEVYPERILELCLQSGLKRRVRDLARYELCESIKSKKIGPSSAELFRPEIRWTTGTEQDFEQSLQLKTAALSLNLSDLMVSWRKIERSFLPWPTMVNIEPTNKCNLKCVMCPRDEMERSLGLMPMPLFRQVIDECKDMNVGQITLNGYGEPFISKDIFEMVSYINQAGIPVKINTNGTYLSEKVIRQLMIDPPTHLSISMDGASKETYEKVRVNAKYDKLMQNLENLMRIRAEEFPHTDMKITLQMIRMDETLDEVQAFLDTWKDKVDEVFVPNVHNWGGVVAKNSLLDDDFPFRFPCKELWRTLMVFYDGSTSICCAVFDNNMNMGNIKGKSLKEIWTSPAYMALREHHLNGDYAKIEICKNCNMWKSYG